ncbi:MAG: hypothetical protein A2Y62_02960 [Candidatus Fischerbacteria bacterium RBG_13_37_8]|uniref:Uncharacterized protein n=1 Tax=Candidatus Fischerbacteria bacterium RBG_13_37_8 TaxID=1817863 RepID=A0A1F5VDX6_9BACT|nr:MAG: hypothetical protein A2Y62_02960 [Candidatus Fischerbacteria bacterium RBG_13_37_8]
MREGTLIFIFVIFVLVTASIFLSSDEEAPLPDKNFFENSLHYTSRGMEYWYSKQQGGIETITEIPYADLKCKNCHISTCDTCHKKTVGSKSEYSAKMGRSQETCLKCHEREGLIITKIDKENNTLDVHFQKGMQCMDCHTKHEIHGDGNTYNSMKQQGALEIKCENCHDRLVNHLSHVVHGQRVDCTACHLRHVATCYNCHLDTFIQQGIKTKIPLSKWIFLMNYNGKVTVANMQTFVYQNKTFLLFAPMFSHSIMREGRQCGECHDTEIIKNIKKKKFYPVTYANGQLTNISGVIPVIENIEWNFIFFNYANGEWSIIDNAAIPLIQYAGFGKPLTQEQFKKLEKAPTFKK